MNTNPTKKVYDYIIERLETLKPYLQAAERGGLEEQLAYETKKAQLETEMEEWINEKLFG